MMEDSTQHDEMLFSMLKECKTLPVFLDQIFGFLKRRTDFYYISTEPNSAVGLPPGLSEQVVKNSYFKWKNQSDTPNLLNGNSVPNKERPKDTKEVTHLKASSLESNNDNTVSESFTKSESYNGAIYNNYSWSQNITEVDVIVKLPSNVTSKNLIVKISSKSISISIKNDKVLLEGELCQKCKQDEAIWSINCSKLEIHLEKCKEMWWDCLVRNEPKLDTTKLDCSRPFEDLPQEAQAKIEELQWNQERKRLGLPTSDQIVLQQKFKKAWDAEGSPFTGPFDPNAVTIHN